MSNAQNRTGGVEVRAGSRWVQDGVELLSSMRFAIALLTLICIASVIGTVVQQHQPPVNYVNQFGPFWADVFGHIGLYAVYSAGWFLLILAFLVTSTTLCIARNTPKILRDLRDWKEGIREASLKAFHHRASGELPLGREAAIARVSGLLAQHGWKARAQVRENGVMVAARQGSANKIGYLAAHSAIVLVCIGGLFDGDLVVRAQMALLGKSTFTSAGLIKDVPAQHRLSPSNPTFRANLFVPENGRNGAAVINLTDGMVLQDLPFDIELKKFVVEYYDTGMPKLFASDVVIHDRDGRTTAAKIKVNEPHIHNGIAIYQSSFDDGGSKLTLRARPFGREGQSFLVKGEVGSSTTLTNRAADGRADQLQLEFTALRVINVENLAGDADGGGEAGSGADVRKVDLIGSLDKHLGSGAKAPGDKKLHNIGPSVTYRLRDAAGQAREYHNYMLPVDMDGVRVFLTGLRESPDAPMRYLRIPADADGKLDDWLRLKTALGDAMLRKEAALRYGKSAAPADKPEMMAQLQASALRTLTLFAGAEVVKAQSPSAGLQALHDFIEANVPETERQRTSEVMLRILSGVLQDLLTLAREREGLPARATDEPMQRFLGQSVFALTDSFAYPAPLMFTLEDFQQIQASVFQVTRAPGKNLVYLGCVLLIIGVVAMLYIRERRLWIWLGGSPDGQATTVSMALSATRQTLDTDKEFDTLRGSLLGSPAAPIPTAATDAGPH
ncbi:cytochrome c biogenesis protein ResB [Sphaerotilus microaerophilus]|uniref:Cytochrome c biogenesis protein n=1 Tax=Sphaerotilus microaerophilus TaxID=2914710 RepID=A0ABM7YFV5_9BURK|nr:cytochrome c biogenesis protein ResB [Sphaerotilus sp. FB-5]BDI03130.1 cytochrome c biogenesis protein [Sphaerotilus sp. FB-5]